MTTKKKKCSENPSPAKRMSGFEKLCWGTVVSVTAIIFTAGIVGEIEAAKKRAAPPYVARPHCRTFEGYDPTRSATEIRKIDYENKRVYYHEPNNGTVRIPTEPLRSGSSGVTLKNGDKTIDTGLSSEEIFDQICRNIDFDDFADYYGYYQESY